MDEQAQSAEPVATLNLTISAERGIEISGDPTPGTHTVGVHFADQTVHENFVGHDVHLARLAADTDLDALAAWMDWRLPGGLETPAPVEFLGGTHEMPVGGKAYFTARLEPGRYAWIAEVDDPMGKKMLKTFTVPEAEDSPSR